MRSGLVSNLKQFVVPRGEEPRSIKTGLFKGLNMSLDLTSQSQIYLGLFEREIYAGVRKLSAGISSAIDIGAACGEYTLYFLTRTEATRILVFEPSEEARAKLLLNLKLNKFANDSRLKIFYKFVGSTDSESSCSLNSLLPLIAMPCLIKMDIDGGEVAVLEGAQMLFQLPQVRWVIETHSPQLERDCISILRRAGYDAKIIPNAWWRLFVPEQRPIEQNRWLFATKRTDVRL
jgi:hypothetical protein